MKTNRWFRYLLLAALISLLVFCFSAIPGGAAPVQKSVLNPNDLQDTPDEGGPDLSQLMMSKKETGVQVKTTSTVDQFNELRYLQLGNMDQEMALIVKLVDKAKLGIVNPTGLVRLLRQRQTQNQGGSLAEQISNLIYELCALDLGKITRRDLLNYIDRMGENDSEYGLLMNPEDAQSSNFQSIIDLIRFNILSPMEAIDSLFILKSKLNNY